jgi:hypothetical protein
MIKIIGGLLMVAAGVVAGLYVGVWWAFIGGIVDIINEIKSVEVTALNVAIGIAKVLFAGFFGLVSAALLILPGALLINKS